MFSVPGALERWHGQYFGFELADGWVDNETRHFREYRGNDHQRNPTFFHNLEQNSDGTVSGSAFLDMMNVKYVAFRAPESPGLGLVMNSSMLPRSWFVPAWEEVPESQTVARMLEEDFDPRRTAFVTGDSGRTGGVRPDEGVPLVAGEEVERRYNYQSYSIDAPSRGVMVVSDVWFPHWQVRVDGQEAPLLRVNHAFRGVMLEPGRHTVEFTYRSPWIRRGLQVSVMSIVLLALLAVVWRRVDAKSGNTSAPR